MSDSPLRAKHVAGVRALASDIEQFVGAVGEIQKLVPIDGPAYVALARLRLSFSGMRAGAQSLVSDLGALAILGEAENAPAATSDVPPPEVLSYHVTAPRRLCGRDLAAGEREEVSA